MGFVDDLDALLDKVISMNTKSKIILAVFIIILSVIAAYLQGWFASLV